MGCETVRSVVLLPIQPRFAEPIISGQKRVEFRKTAFSRRPSHVVVYSSSPVQRVVGYFTVTHVEVAPIEDLWERYENVGGIERDDFFAYYEEREEGVVLGVGEVVALERPLTLSEAGLDARPPQSFCYLNEDFLTRLAVEATAGA